MGIGIAGLALLAVLLVVGYRTMIAVKPNVARPVPDEAARAEIRALEPRLMAHVTALADRIGERHLERPRAYQAAADYIRQVWTAQGLLVTEEPFEVNGQRAVNLIVELRGAERPRDLLVIGAHYDTAAGSPGANDNGSGVAVLLELSRALATAPLYRTVRLVAFANEEPPHFAGETMGSRVHARNARRRGETIAAMLSLETVGYYSDAPGSQAYPFPFGLLYPGSGNFLAVVGNLRSRPLVVDVLRHFMAAGDFPVEGIATFEQIPGITWSDHWAFWQEGYPAVMLTDTAPFRFPDYHGAQDLPGRIAAPAFARAAHAILQTVRRLAGP
jgi:hypothetical protein